MSEQIDLQPGLRISVQVSKFPNLLKITNLFLKKTCLQLKPHHQAKTRNQLITCASGPVEPQRNQTVPSNGSITMHTNYLIKLIDRTIKTNVILLINKLMLIGEFRNARFICWFWRSPHRTPHITLQTRFNVSVPCKMLYEYEYVPI